MKKSSLFLIAGVFAIAAATAVQAATPAAPAAPAAAAPPPITPPTFGAPIPGQCVLDTQTVMVSSKMGVAALARLTTLKQGVEAELTPENDALTAMTTTLKAKQKAATTPALQKQFQTDVAAYQQRGQAFQAKEQQRQQEMQYTQQTVMQAIFQKMIPQINAVVTQRGCSTVVTSDSLLHYDLGGDAQTAPTSFVYANPAMDITQAVVAKMDSTGETLPNFDRAHVPEQAGGGQ